MIEEVKAVLMQILTLEQWKTWVFIVIITSGLTETAKRTFFLTMTKVKKKQWVYGTAFTAGCITAVTGWSMVGVDSTPDYLWLMFGVTAGPVSNFMHWVTLGAVAWKFPELAAALKGKR